VLVAIDRYGKPGGWSMNNSPDSKKPYELKFEDRNDYLYASVTSEDEGCSNATGDYIGEIGEACRDTGCVRLLIEKVIPNTLWLWDSIFVLNYFPKIGLSDIKVALVDTSATIFDPEGFGVCVGCEPKVDMHVVSSFDAGESWLRK
jgi:hypothetical protein